MTYVCVACTQVVVLDAGLVIEQGSPEDLLDSDRRPSVTLAALWYHAISCRSSQLCHVAE